MKYQEFVCAVETRMNKQMEGGMKASLQKTVKNNGTERMGLVIETPGRNIFPTIYLEEFYERYRKGETMDAVIDSIFKFYQDTKMETATGVFVLEHFEQIHDKIVFKLINTKQNEELLREVPNIPFLDLSIVFYVLLTISGKGTATMLIRQEHLQIWKVKQEDVMQAAGENTIRLLPAELYTMREMVGQLMHPANGGKMHNILGKKEEDACKERDFMYVLTNRLKSFGAACMLYPHILEKIGNIVGEDFFVIPSSIHEVLIVPESFSMDQDEMDEMVIEINEDHVAEEEVLGNHTYFYEREEGRLSLQDSINC